MLHCPDHSMMKCKFLNSTFFKTLKSVFHWYIFLNRVTVTFNVNHSLDSEASQEESAAEADQTPVRL